MNVDLTRRGLFKAAGAGLAIAGLAPSSVVRADVAFGMSIRSRRRDNRAGSET